jgi:ubiquinone biosynthesis protein
MVGILKEDIRRNTVDLFQKLVDNNTEGVIYKLKKLAVKEKFADEQGFDQDVELILNKWYGQEIAKVSFVGTIYKIICVGAKYGYSFNPNLILLGKALLDVEGIGYIINPKANIEHLLKPYMKKIIMRKYNPKNIIEKKIKYLKNNDFFINFPEHIISLIEKIEKGDFEVHSNLDELYKIEKRAYTIANEHLIGLIFPR